MGSLQVNRQGVAIPRAGKDRGTWICAAPSCTALRFDAVRLHQHLRRRHGLSWRAADELMAHVPNRPAGF